jgi:hypothetical protein
LNRMETAMAEHEAEMHCLPTLHYYVPVGGPEGDPDVEPALVEVQVRAEPTDGVDRFLVLPQEEVPVHASLPASWEPVLDQSFSHILTSDEFVAILEAKAARKEALQEEARQKKLALEESKERRKAEKLEKARKNKQRAEEHAIAKREREYWDKVKEDGWRDKLHKLIRETAG